MRFNTILSILFQLFFVVSLCAQIEIENTEENCPDRGADPCVRNTQIATNPFSPFNTEWYTMRNRFNWMDYVTWHKEKVNHRKELKF